MPLPRFAKLPEDRRRRILDAALDGFAAEGYASASFNRILAHAGISKGAMYYYFEDKEDLYITVLEHALEGIGDIPELALAPDAASFWADAACAYDAALAAARRDPRVVRMLEGLSGDLDRLAHSPRVAGIMDGCTQWFGTAIAHGRQCGAVRDDLPPEQIVDLVFTLGQFADRWMLALGELETDAGCRRARDRGMDLMRRALAPH